MRCDAARAAVSAAADGELEATGRPALDEHLAGCAACRAFDRRVVAIRQALRFEVVGDVPDVVPRVRVALDSHPRRARTPVRARVLVAAVVAGAVVGALLVSGGRPGQRPPAVAADVPAKVLAAQADVSSLTADFTVVERGWHPAVPVRRFATHVVYRAPEQLLVDVVDRTRYPSAAWHRNDVSFVVDGGTAWSSAPAACPRDALPRCTPDAPRVRVVRGREPFAPDDPAPLDLVVPVLSFAGGSVATRLPDRDVAGRHALGVRTTAAQLAPLLDGLRPAGAWRELDPSDVADVWLDETTLVPLAVRVVPAATAERAARAAARGYRDAPGVPVFEATAHAATIDRAVTASFPNPPATAFARDGGFRDSAVPPADAPAPTWLPGGLAPARAGEVRTPAGPPVAVRTWTDGRAWLAVRATRAWPGGRLFGDLGDAVSRMALSGAGVAYVAEGGRRVALHGAAIDVVVAGSLPAADLARVAASLGVVGLPVPADWAEGRVTTVAAAGGAVPGLLVPAGRLGFGPPAVRVDGDVVTLALAGAGDRTAVVVETPGTALAPPFDDDVRAVDVRGRAGRWAPAQGVLEWVEGGLVVEVRSRTLDLDALLGLAARLERAR